MIHNKWCEFNKGSQCKDNFHHSFCDFPNFLEDGTDLRMLFLLNIKWKNSLRSGDGTTALWAREPGTLYPLLTNNKFRHIDTSFCCFGATSPVSIYDVTQCLYALSLFHPLYSVSLKAKMLKEHYELICAITTSSLLICSLPAVRSWSLACGVLSWQSFVARRPFGCETKFTSRTKHHVTTISKNDEQR